MLRAGLTPLGPHLAARPRRWFLYSLIGLFLFLGCAIVLAAFLLLQRGRLPKTGIVAGNSMEPALEGPRFLWTCGSCATPQEFALDSCLSHQPLRCNVCNQLETGEPFDFGDRARLSERIEPGALVRFAALRSVRAARALGIASGEVHPSGLRRGEVVVLQESLGATREIKRLVGLPNEQISIDQGDVWVNKARWAKSLEQALRQAVLVNAWDGVRAVGSVGNALHTNGTWSVAGHPFHGILQFSESNSAIEASPNELTFDYPSPRWIDNRLSINAHDSHAIVPVVDFGIAFQLTQLESSWEVRCRFCSMAMESVVQMEQKGVEVTIRCGSQVANVTLSQSEEKSVWIALARVDGFLVVGSQNEEWFRCPSPTISPVDVAEDRPVSITMLSGKLAVDQLLIFRDVYYRGNGDANGQTWEAGDQVIVLGDNVSLSSDSRDRWPEGLPLHAVKGVVLQTDSVMETLLRQRN